MTEAAKRFGTHFRLRPFTSGPLVDELSLTACIAGSADTLSLEYMLHGSLEGIDISSISSLNDRCHELWRHTCFELFFGLPGETAYWEVNLALSGCWNFYRFDDYRTGMRPEATAGPRLFHVVTETDLLSLACTFDLNGIVENTSQLEVAVSSVIETIDGNFSYWAVEHLGTAPDFHDRRTFRLLL